MTILSNIGPSDYLSAVSDATDVIVQPTTLFFIFIATLLSLFMGVIPGLGGVVALTLLIPITFGMDPLLAFAILSAATGGANFGGSVTSILINVPGKSGCAATLLDGYPMSRDDRAEEALGASAVASALGSFGGVTITVLTIPIMVIIIGFFGQPETFWLAIWGLVVVSVIVKGNVIGGIFSAGIGVIFALHGATGYTATVRWDYGLAWMRDGMELIPILIGLFAFSEMIKLMAEGGKISTGDNEGLGELTSKKGTRWDGVRAVFRHKEVFIRSSFIGGIIGIIPAVGSTAANFLAYFHAVKTTENPESYGTGDVRGVIAPEASNDAKDGTSFIPTLAFGIPGSSSMAVLLSAFILHGLDPGPGFLEANLDIVAIIVIAFVMSNLITSTIGVLAADQLYKITQLDVRYLVPVVLVLAFFGAYAVDNNIYATGLAAFAGIFGYLLIKIKVSRIPLILGLVLGPIIESSFFASYRMAQGDLTIFVDSVISIFLIVLIAMSIGYPWIQYGISRLNKEHIEDRDTVAETVSSREDDDNGDEIVDDEQSAEAELERKLWPGTHWQYKIAFLIGILTWITYMLAEALTYDEFADTLFPLLALPVTGLLVFLYIIQQTKPSIWYKFLPQEGESQLESLFKGPSTRTLYEEQKTETLMVLWLVSLILGSFILGMDFFIPIWTFAFVYWATGSYKKSAVFSTIFIVFVFIVFMHLLNMIVYTGRYPIYNPIHTVEFWLTQLLN